MTVTEGVTAPHAPLKVLEVELKVAVEPVMTTSPAGTLSELGSKFEGGSRKGSLLVLSAAPQPPSAMQKPASPQLLPIAMVYAQASVSRHTPTAHWLGGLAQLRVRAEVQVPALQ